MSLNLIDQAAQRKRIDELLSNPVESAKELESLRQQLASRDAEIAELVAALDNSIFVFDLDPKIAKALAKVRKP